MDDAELTKFLQDLEADNVERKASLRGDAKERICQAICAFANDLANRGTAGYIFVGANDDGRPTGLAVTDHLLQELAAIRSDGNILPFPTMTVQKRLLFAVEMAVIEVLPSDSPPVRYKGVTYIRVGPRRAIATKEEERRLTEKRLGKSLSFDRRPVPDAGTVELDVDFFRQEYLPHAVAPHILEDNTREIADQLASLRFLASSDGPPTAAGILVLGRDPQLWIPGAYVQFVRIDGTELTDPIKDEKELRGTISHQCRLLDDLLAVNISTSVAIPETGAEIRQPDYPLVALQQLVRNALMHRDYETSNAPVRVFWYADRIEMENPGGLYGQVTPENFGQTTDYRNPQLAEAMKTLGFVQRFGVGIQIARKALRENDNPDPEFRFEPSYFSVTVRSRG